MSNYRIPDISEFKQGFEFEYLDKRDYKFVIIDFSNNCKIKEETPYHVEEWLANKVTWKRDPKERFEFEEEGINWNVSGSYLNFFTQWDDDKISKYIKNGRIRVR